MWLLFLHRNKGILAFLRTRSMVFASLTYLDSLNMYIALYSYKALTELSEKRLVSTEPSTCYSILYHLLSYCQCSDREELLLPQIMLKPVIAKVSFSFLSNRFLYSSKLIFSGLTE